MVFGKLLVVGLVVGLLGATIIGGLYVILDHRETMEEKDIERKSRIDRIVDYVEDEEP